MGREQRCSGGADETTVVQRNARNLAETLRDQQDTKGVFFLLLPPRLRYAYSFLCAESTSVLLPCLQNVDAARCVKHHGSLDQLHSGHQTQNSATREALGEARRRAALPTRHMTMTS